MLKRIRGFTVSVVMIAAAVPPFKPEEHDQWHIDVASYYQPRAVGGFSIVRTSTSTSSLTEG
jgi:hypothetical protein